MRRSVLNLLLIMAVLFASTLAVGAEVKSAKFYFNRGFEYAKKGKLDQAIADYTKALELNPKFDWAYYNRGNAYGKKGRHDRAIADYNKALEINPRFFLAYFNRGNAYEKKGRHARAIADYTKVIELNPRYAAAYNNRAIAYYHQKDYDKAWKGVLKAQSLGFKVHPGFLEDLRKASGREK